MGAAGSISEIIRVLWKFWHPGAQLRVVLACSLRWYRVERNGINPAAVRRGREPAGEERSARARAGELLK